MLHKPHITLSFFSKANFKQMEMMKGTYFVVVIEDLNLEKIVGMGTLVVELKFIRGGSKVSLYY